MTHLIAPTAKLGSERVHKLSKLYILWQLIVFAGGACVLALIILHQWHLEALQHPTQRFLEMVARSKGVQVTLTPRVGSKLSPENTNFRAILFPVTTNNDHRTIRFDGQLSYSVGHREFKFTLLNNRGFVTIHNQTSGALLLTKCLEPSNVPPLHLIADAVRSARVIDDVSSDTFNIKCGDGKLVELFFANEPYVFCAGNTAGVVEKIHGEDLEAAVALLNEHTEETPPRSILAIPQKLNFELCRDLDQEDDSGDLADFSLADFGMDENPPSVAGAIKSNIDKAHRRLRSLYQQNIHPHIQRLHYRALDVLAVSRGKRRLGAFNTFRCKTCRGGKKVCLFIHGYRRRDEKPVHPEEASFKRYWGSIQNHVPCCSSTTFLRLDTMRNPWMSPNITSRICEAAMRLSGSTNSMSLENVAFIGHSMGNMIIAGAVLHNQCAIGPTSLWISLQGLLVGTETATLAMKLCSSEGPLRQALEAVRFCPYTQGVQSLQYITSKTMPPEVRSWYARALNVHRKMTTSCLCGVNSMGLLSPQSAMYGALSAVTPHHTPDDGVVELRSCKGLFTYDMFARTYYGNRFYEASINHGDGRFQNGDGWWGANRKPVAWLQCQFA
uniref:Uncharacterized protein AlNc14C62G4504 n=1 Tax=Albugo laibachii Nc14 TaxID=890382 RepID=F0WCX9_9STRA|nr:conserved hypothetical protein [Albugo laibachii Nc14]|eukprot:CCA19050.1 conserved hypothetical protein [Albugo laibachii Nc14]